MPNHGTISSIGGPPSSAPRVVVYPWQARGVNRRLRLPALLLPALLAVSGCAVTPPTPPPRYLLALRYDLGAGLREQGRATFRQDLSTLAELGFPTVVLTNTPDAERGALLDAAQEAGLRAVVGAATVQAQLEPGAETGWTLRQELLRAWPAKLHDHPAWEAALIDARGSSARYLRAVKWKQHPVPFRIVCLGPNVSARDEPGILTIHAAHLDPEQEASLTQQALWRYHTGLRMGRTGGLLFDRYRDPAGDSSDAYETPEPLTPTLSTAVQTLAERAGRWGPKLFAARARAVSVPYEAYRGAGGARRTARYGDLAFTEFVRGRRRYLMVFNRALDQHVRGPCVLSALIDEQEVRRAVEIPGSSVRVAGEVVQARAGKLTLQLELRPGDAVLYELF